ncbi:hypothetical protein ACHAPJ_000815 [Fusarium lateritium]
MKLSSLVLLTYTGLSLGLTQQCTGNAINEGGNWFCGAVKEILYQGFSSSGSYKTVTNMGNDGSCQTQPFSYSGTLGPLSEDLSIHIRGPFKLREFAVYNLDSSQKKREAAPSPHINTHPHGHSHLHEQRKQKRGQWVTATINGQVVSWENTWFGGPATQAAPAPAPAAPTKKPVSKPKPNTGSEIKPSQVNTAPVVGGYWKRTSYYNAQRRVTNNVMFMGNYGGQGSGVFD